MKRSQCPKSAVKSSIKRMKKNTHYQTYQQCCQEKELPMPNRSIKCAIKRSPSPTHYSTVLSTGMSTVPFRQQPPFPCTPRLTRNSVMHGVGFQDTRLLGPAGEGVRHVGEGGRLPPVVHDRPAVVLG